MKFFQISFSCVPLSFASPFRSPQDSLSIIAHPFRFVKPFFEIFSKFIFGSSFLSNSRFFHFVQFRFSPFRFALLRVCAWEVVLALALGQLTSLRCGLRALAAAYLCTIIPSSSLSLPFASCHSLPRRLDYSTILLPVCQSPFLPFFPFLCFAQNKLRHSNKIPTIRPCSSAVYRNEPPVHKSAIADLMAVPLRISAATA